MVDLARRVYLSTGTEGILAKLAGGFLPYLTHRVGEIVARNVASLLILVFHGPIVDGIADFTRKTIW